MAFAIFFAGVAGPNAASGVTAALLAYVLPVASPGTIGDVPSRLAGWWLASVAGTAAVLLLSPRSQGDRLRAAAAALATALASHLEAAGRGEADQASQDATVEAKHQLMNLFAATPYRPTGLATADQGLANITELLEWVTSLTTDALDGHVDLRQATPADHELLGAAATMLADVALLLGDQDVPTAATSRATSPAWNAPGRPAPRISTSSPATRPASRRRRGRRCTPRRSRSRRGPPWPTP